MSDVQQKPSFLADDVLQDCQRIDNLFIPRDYEVWSTGVVAVNWANRKTMHTTPSILEPLPSHIMEGRTRISQRGVWISNHGDTLIGKEPLVELTYYTVDGQRASMWVDRRQITSERELAALGAQGLPFDSENAKACIVYLKQQEALNGTLMQRQCIGDRSGPYDVLINGVKQRVWLLGANLIGPPGCILPDPRHHTRFVEAFIPKGDVEEWFAMCRRVMAMGWVNEWFLYTYIAALIMRDCGVRSHFVHHWGTSGQGKTALATFKCSMGGNPTLLLSTFNSTLIGLTELFRHFTDMGSTIDEKQIEGVNTANLIYTICTGRSRDRGAKDGGIRQGAYSYVTICHTTGETPLVDSSDVGGQFNRVKQVSTPAFTNEQSAFARELYNFSLNNYGHAVPAFLKEYLPILNAPGGLQRIQETFAKFHEALQARVGHASPHVQYAALHATAGYLFKVLVLKEDPIAAQTRAVDVCHNALMETAPTARDSYMERGLNALRDHAISNPFMYTDDTSRESRFKAEKAARVAGVKTDWGMMFVPSVANEILKRAGLSPERVWQDMNKAGWLVNDGVPGRYTTVLEFFRGTQNFTVYAVRAEIFFGEQKRKPLLEIVANSSLTS